MPTALDWAHVQRQFVTRRLLAPHQVTEVASTGVASPQGALLHFERRQRNESPAPDPPRRPTALPKQANSSAME